MKTVIFTLLLTLVVHADNSGTEFTDRYKLYLQNPAIYKRQIASEGKAIFQQRCAYCHGDDGSGQGGFAADLRKRISKESAMHVIRNGANNFNKDFPNGMPAMIKDEQTAQTVAEFIALGMPDSHPGAKIYKNARCAMCHRSNGNGFGTYGSGERKIAPNIKKFDLKTLMSILKHGKEGTIGKMYSFHALADEELKIVALYVMSLSGRSDNP